MSKAVFKREELFDLIGKTFYRPHWGITGKEDSIVVNGKKYVNYDIKNRKEVIHPFLGEFTIRTLTINGKNTVIINDGDRHFGADYSLFSGEFYEDKEEARAVAFQMVRDYLAENPENLEADFTMKD